MKKIKKFFKKNLINNSNDILKICLITVLCILLLNRRYTFQILCTVLIVSVITFSIFKNVLSSLLLSLIISYALLTYFYKLKLENFQSKIKDKKKIIPKSFLERHRKVENSKRKLNSFEQWKEAIDVKSVDEANYIINNFEELEIPFHEDIISYAEKYLKEKNKLEENEKCTSKKVKAKLPNVWHCSRNKATLFF